MFEIIWKNNPRNNQKVLKKTPILSQAKPDALFFSEKFRHLPLDNFGAKTWTKGDNFTDFYNRTGLNWTRLYHIGYESFNMIYEICWNIDPNLTYQLKRGLIIEHGSLNQTRPKSDMNKTNFKFKKWTFHKSSTNELAEPTS